METHIISVAPTFRSVDYRFVMYEL